MQLLWDEESIRFDPGQGGALVQVRWQDVRTLGRWMDRDSFPFFCGDVLVSDQGEAVQLLRLPFGLSSKETVGMWDAWRKRCPEDQRTGTHWPMPHGQGATLLGHPTRWTEALVGPRPLVHVGAGQPLPFPTPFLRSPELFIRDAFPSPLVLPALLEGAEVSTEKVCRASDLVALVPGRRAGSRFASSGGMHTAAVFETHDSGQHWVELSLERVERAKVNWGDYSWPPERIDGARYEQGRPTIYFEDPWVDFEPGSRWRAHHDPTRDLWVMEYLDDGWMPPP